MGKVIVVASGKGGTGKTTAVAAVSSCLAALGHKTLCIDCDAGLRNLDISLCMTDFAVSDFTDVLEGLLPLEDACVEHPRIENLYFLSAPAFTGPEDIDAEGMAELIESAKEHFDYCLIDSPAGIGAGFRLASRGADMAIIVSTGDVSSVRDAQRAAELAYDMGIPETRLLVNRIRRRTFNRIDATVDDVIDDVSAQLIGVVSEDEAVFLSAHNDTPLILTKPKAAARQFLDIARRLTGESLPLNKI